MAATATMDEFEALLNESLTLETPDEGSVVKGTVLAVERLSLVRKPAVKKLGIASKKRTTSKSVLKVRSLAASKVASQLILAAQLPSCRALRLMCAPCVMHPR